MIDPSNNNYNNGMKDQFLGKMYQIVSMCSVRKKHTQTKVITYTWFKLQGPKKILILLSIDDSMKHIFTVPKISKK